VLIGHFFFVTLFLYAMPMIPSGPKGLTEKTIDGQKDLCRDEKLLKKTRKREHYFAIDLLKNKSVDEIPNFILKTLPKHVRDGVFRKLSGNKVDYCSVINFSKTSGGAHDCSLMVGDIIEHEARENKRKFSKIIGCDMSMQDVGTKQTSLRWLVVAKNMGSTVVRDMGVNKPTEISIFDIAYQDENKLFLKQFIDVAPELKQNCESLEIKYHFPNRFSVGTEAYNNNEKGIEENVAIEYGLAPHEYSKSLEEAFAYYIAHMIQVENISILQNKCHLINYGSSRKDIAIVGRMLSYNDVDFIYRRIFASETIVPPSRAWFSETEKLRLEKMPKEAYRIVETCWRKRIRNARGRNLNLKKN
jgi:hypothetical protein